MIGCRSRAGPSTTKRKVARVRGGQFIPHLPHRLRQIIGRRGGGAQVVHRGPALRDGLIRAVEGLLEFNLRLALRKQVVHHLKTQHQALKALQQRVMQIARDAGALTDAFVHAHVEFARDLMEPVPVQPPQQRQTERCRTDAWNQAV